VGTLLAVGHNPGFSDLANWLAGSGDAAGLNAMRLKYPTAALAILDFESDHWRDVRKGAARLKRFVTPAMLHDDLIDDPD
ncbi:MAG: histidine phosphatase family protein, partial [Methylocystis sp.]|nr:histidine phosphatase family protein [Methylocystis sp.]